MDLLHQWSEAAREGSAEAVRALVREEAEVCGTVAGAFGHGQGEMHSAPAKSGSYPAPARRYAMRHLESWRSIVREARTRGSVPPHQEQALAEAEEAVRLLDAT